MHQELERPGDNGDEEIRTPPSAPLPGWPEVDPPQEDKDDDDDDDDE